MGSFFFVFNRMYAWEDNIRELGVATWFKLPNSAGELSCEWLVAIYVY